MCEGSPFPAAGLCLYARFDMVGSSTPLPAPHVALIFHPFDEAGRNGAERIEVSGLEHALDGLGCTKSGFLGRMLGRFDR